MNVRSSRMQVNARGFSLIELMIVVAVIGILAAVAYPSYTNYVIKSNRSAAQAFMMDIANREKQYFLDARQYLAIDADSGFTTLNMSIPNEVSGFYDIRVPSATVTTSPPAFSVTATPKTGTRQVPDGALTLTHDGQKSPPDKW